MSYLSAWKVLEEMIADFKKRGLSVPPQIIDDLKSAKTLINILKADSPRSETCQKIEGYLLNVESYLASEGQKELGAGYVDKWLKKLDEATRKPFDEEEKETTFIPGIPREHKWIRVKLTPELPVQNLKALAEASKLSFKTQSDGYLLVYGEDACIKDFVKNMTTKYGMKAGK